MKVGNGSADGPHHYLFDSPPESTRTRDEKIDEANGLWASDPDAAARIYFDALGSRQGGDHIMLARVGSTLPDKQLRELYFSQARAGAKINGAPIQEVYEIKALSRWARKRDRGKELTLPAEFVSQRLARLATQREALVVAISGDAPAPPAAEVLAA